MQPLHANLRSIVTTEPLPHWARQCAAKASTCCGLCCSRCSRRLQSFLGVPFRGPKVDANIHFVGRNGYAKACPIAASRVACYWHVQYTSSYLSLTKQTSPSFLAGILQTGLQQQTTRGAGEGAEVCQYATGEAQATWHGTGSSAVTACSPAT